MEDLKKLTGTEELKSIGFTDISGKAHWIPGARFTMGKAAIILQEFSRLAKEINFSDKWREASERSEKSREHHATMLAQIGPAPIYPEDELNDPDGGNFNPEQFNRMIEEHNKWYQRYLTITPPRSVISILQESLVSELVTLIDVAPDVIFKLMAYTISDWNKDLKPAKREGNLDEFIKAKVDWCEDNIDLSAGGEILVGMFKLVGVESFFKSLQNLIMGEPEEEPETLEEPEESPPIKLERKKRTLSKES